MFSFVFLLGAFVAVIVLALGLPLFVTPVVVALLAAYVGISYAAAPRALLGMSEAHEVSPEKEPELHRVVENLCIGAGLPVPKVYVIEDGAPNAFATGRDPQHASIAVTRGLLGKLDKLELEGVIAHELSHVGNEDTRLLMVAVILVGLIALLADFILRWTWYGAGRRSRYKEKGGGGGAAILLVVALVLAVLVPIVAQALRFAISRQREYLADASGALLTRYPEGLARALEKIAADPDPLEVANKATAPLYIANPLTEHQSFLNNLFDTHPPIRERIALLRAM